MKTALLKFDQRSPEHTKILEAARMSGIIASSDNDFQPIREWLRKVGVDLTN